LIKRGTGRQYSDAVSEVPITLWLPDSVERIVEAMADERQTTRSKLLRHILFRHLYGTLDLHALARRGNQTYSGWHDEEPMKKASSKRFELMVEFKPQVLDNVPDLEHSVANLKVFVSRQIKEDLASMARIKGMQLSAYARHVVMTDLLGHTAVLPIEQPPVGLES
jgi:hypothetical protein